MCACLEPVKLLLLAAGVEFSSSLAAGCKPQTYTHTQSGLLKCMEGMLWSHLGMLFQRTCPTISPSPLFPLILTSKEKKNTKIFTHFCFSFQVGRSHRKNITDLLFTIKLSSDMSKYIRTRFKCCPEKKQCISLVLGRD